jgi:regulation of enolase protein 1 (concanavalin A-like superfamily)
MARILLCCKPNYLILLTSLMAGLAAPAAEAQGPPLLPAVDLTAAPLAGDMWPADFNRDGKTDLVGRGVAVALGIGDGSFGPPSPPRDAGEVLAIGDLDLDGRVDVVAEAGGGLLVFPGLGGGAFGEPRVVFDAGREGEPGDPTFRFASAADMDNDGVRDLVVGLSPQELLVFGGNGDLTFDAPLSLPTAWFPYGHIVADVDDDGRRDVVVAHESFSLIVFRNNGGLSFTPRELPIDRSSTDVTARDLDGDGRLDLVVSARSGRQYGPWTDGYVYVYRGTGAGAFAAPLRFPTPSGTHSVVVGEFTRDGRIDVATTNRTFREVDRQCGPYRHGVDNISILPGNGDGTFGAAISFALGSQVDAWEPGLQNVIGTLNTSDLNGDGQTDLIASQGVVALNAAPRANRAPVVSAGEDETYYNMWDYIAVNGGGVDPDRHLLQFRWLGPDGAQVDLLASTCVHVPSPSGDYAFRITASDGLGGTASDDKIITHINFDDQVPQGWSSEDVGATGAAGSGVGTWEMRVRGGGADVWGTADAFHFLHQPVTGDFEITTKVLSIENVDVWTKAGLMVREGTGAGARHASIFVTPTTTKGIAFQRRPTTNGTSLHTAGPMVTAPYWIRLKRTGNVVSAYASQHGTFGSWALVGRQTFTSLSETVEVGVAVSSHRAGVVAEATFQEPLVVQTPLWGLSDVGATGVPGNQDFNGFPNQFTIEASGADIWGTADAFRFLHTDWTLDGTITARVRSIERTNDWAKAGVMFRESLAPGSRQVMLVVSAARGLAMQYRAGNGSESANVALQPGVAAPEWVRLTRAGNTFTGYASEDGTAWRRIGSVTIAMTGDAYAGVAVTSHDNSTLATAAFEGLDLKR